MALETTEELLGAETVQRGVKLLLVQPERAHDPLFGPAIRKPALRHPTLDAVLMDA
jgi:hypothetical protein